MRYVCAVHLAKNSARVTVAVCCATEGLEGNLVLPLCIHTVVMMFLTKKRLVLVFAGGVRLHSIVTAHDDVDHNGNRYVGRCSAS